MYELTMTIIQENKYICRMRSSNMQKRNYYHYVQQRLQSPTVTLTWHASKHKITYNGLCFVGSLVFTFISRLHTMVFVA